MVRVHDPLIIRSDAKFGITPATLDIGCSIQRVLLLHDRRLDLNFGEHDDLAPLARVELLHAAQRSLEEPRNET